MRLLIDGYNLLHATDLFGAGELAGTLRGSREALLAFLVARLTARERRATTIVFDAADAPVGLPDRYDLDGIDVRFARGYADADSMIEEILETVKGPRQLIVVSGDRRVQRAARSSGAKPVDSDAWFGDLCRRAVEPAGESSQKTPVGSNEQWVREFSDPEALAEIERQAEAEPPPKTDRRDGGAPPAPTGSEDPPVPAKKNRKPRKHRPDPSAKSSAGFGAGVFDPFPPGYAEDLLQRFPETPPPTSDEEPGPEDRSNRQDRD